MEESLAILNASAKPSLPMNNNNPIEKLEDCLNENSTGICRKRIVLVPNAQNVKIEEQWIYTGHLSILVEQRWATKKSCPYNDNDICPNEPVGDIWADYEFDPPKTTTLNRPELLISKNLDKTKHKEDCLECQENQRTECAHCKNKRCVVTWTQLNIKWSNKSSSIQYSTFNQDSYPQSIINETSTTKVKCFEFDDAWESTRKTLDSILDTCEVLPSEFRAEMNHKFTVHQRADKVLRLKCFVERLRVEKIDYQMNGHPDQTFTFFLVGEDRKVHHNESSFPFNGQQYKTTCSVL